MVMNYIITETQKNALEEYNLVKKIFFKYWDRMGPDASKETISRLFATDPYGRINTGKSILHKANVQDMLKEWYGIDKAFEIAKEMLLNKVHSIGDEFRCGGYVFDFKVTNFVDRSKNDNWRSDIDINVVVDSDNGKVTLVMTDGVTYNLGDAWSNEDYGWEIDNEIAECIYDYFYDKITEKTGVRIDINSISENYK